MDQVADPRDKLDLSSLPLLPGQALPSQASPEVEGGRPWLGIYFRCAGIYSRAYRNADGTCYLARCPKCNKSMRFAVGPGGSSERSFQVSC
jgi:hypothetical protein